ncbi:MAG TPA: glycosyltransferase family 39 protein [Thermoanaerobaculia bacterium]|nr:glycosyltransferase family 39 protein [Thermoanaerobaculia bacterium]
MTLREDSGPRTDPALAGLNTSRRILAIFGSVIVLGFIALRVAFLLAREPFFDDLFTVWIARMDLTGLFTALRLDSGPPLYYLFVHLLLLGFPSDQAAIEVVSHVRAFSLVVSLFALALVLFARHLGPARYLAALLLAVFPPHILFSTEARAYALCALLAGVTVLSLHRWIQTSDMRLLFVATTAATLAAYSHYYGVVILPLPFVAAIFRGRELMVRGLIASAFAFLLFLPGFYLASSQPDEATRWMVTSNRDGLGVLLSTAQQLGFAARYPDALLKTPPFLLQIVSISLVALTVAWGIRRSVHARFFGAMTLTPIVMLAAIAQLRGSVYFPVRFESVLTIPFALLLAFSLVTLHGRVRVSFMATFLILGTTVAYGSLMAQTADAQSPFRRTAAVARASIGSDAVILASGFSYLELASQSGRDWSPRIISFPSDQSLHPGWRSAPSQAQLDAERDALLLRLPGQFAWVGEGSSPEFLALSRACASRPVYSSGPVFIAIFSCRPTY